LAWQEKEDSFLYIFKQEFKSRKNFQHVLGCSSKKRARVSGDRAIDISVNPNSCLHEITSESFGAEILLGEVCFCGDSEFGFYPFLGVVIAEF
jgi:hypothetical protein